MLCFAQLPSFSLITRYEAELEGLRNSALETSLIQSFIFILGRVSVDLPWHYKNEPGIHSGWVASLSHPLACFLGDGRKPENPEKTIRTRHKTLDRHESSGKCSIFCDFIFESKFQDLGITPKQHHPSFFIYPQGNCQSSRNVSSHSIPDAWAISVGIWSSWFDESNEETDH